MHIVMTQLPSGRQVYDTSRVLIGIRAQDNKMPRAANDDETAIQDIVRGMRPPRCRPRGVLRLRYLALLAVAVVAALVALSMKFAAMVTT